MKYSLIVPIAADNEHSLKLLVPENGLSLCMRAICGLDLSDCSHIYLTVLKKHSEQFCLESSFREQFEKLGIGNASLCILDSPTRSEPQTVVETIRREGISGPVFIKDADSYFKCSESPLNSIAVFPLESMDWVNPKDKSYVQVDDNYFVTNIVEKRVISNLFSAGGYGFGDAGLLCETYDKLASYEKLYLSHIIFYLLLHKVRFRPLMVSDYQDLNR